MALTGKPTGRHRLPTSVPAPMLRNTFIHLPGIGQHREQQLWRQGVLDWDCFLTAASEGWFSARMCQRAVPMLQECEDAIVRRAVGFLGNALPQREMWRLYPDFADRALFLDIETTGLSADGDDVTVIGALGGGNLALFIKRL